MAPRFAASEAGGRLQLNLGVLVSMPFAGDVKCSMSRFIGGDGTDAFAIANVKK